MALDLLGFSGTAKVSPHGVVIVQRAFLPAWDLPGIFHAPIPTRY
jgi:hypothetical protein